jgi:adenosylhomocysteine nucleosidase
MKLAIFSAFPQEIKPIAKKFRPFKKVKTNPFNIYLAAYSSCQIIFVLTGMGISNAEAAVKYIHTEYNPDFIISAGFGGAVYDGAKIGDLIWASSIQMVPDVSKNIWDSYNNDRIFKALGSRIGIRKGAILTLNGWMKKKEIRQAISDELSLPVCDMETFPLAHIATQRGVPFHAIRSITDTAEQDISFNPYEVVNRSNNYRLSKVLCLIMRKPGLIPEMIRLCRNSKTASKKLSCAVTALIEILIKEGKTE